MFHSLIVISNFALFVFIFLTFLYNLAFFIVGEEASEMSDSRSFRLKSDAIFRKVSDLLPSLNNLMTNKKQSPDSPVAKSLKKTLPCLTLINKLNEGFKSSLKGLRIAFVGISPK